MTRTTHAKTGTPSEIAASSVEEIDGYEASVQGVQIEAIRTGEGSGPNSVVAAQSDTLTLTAAKIGFPILTSTTVGDDTIVMVRILSAPRGSRWCGLDLAPGAVLLYSPGAEHVGVNPPGLAFAFAAVRLDTLAEAADRLEIDFRPPPRGEVRALALSAPTERAAGSSLGMLAADASWGAPPGEGCEGDFVRLLAGLLSRRSPAHRAFRTRRRGLDSGVIVRTCLAYAQSIGHLPTNHDLSRAAGISERRLYLAFEATVGTSPGRFFRAWGLDQARRRLLAAGAHQGHVTPIASDLGFTHLGRFAGYYRQAFGETPSETLSSSPAALGSLRSPTDVRQPV